MNNKLFITIAKFVVALSIISIVGWLIFEFVYKGAVVIDANGNAPLTTITDLSGNEIAKDTAQTFRLTPGSYIVSVTNNTSGISKRIDVTPLTTTHINLPATNKISAAPVAPVALYGVIPGNDSVLGYDPTDERIKRVTKTGEVTNWLTSPETASRWEAELPNKVVSYQPYQHNQALVATNGLLYNVSRTAIQEISTAGINIDHTTSTPPLLTIAAQPQSASFVVAYKQDIYWYETPLSQPKKIYTAKKRFDSVAYGNGRIGIYYADMPDSQQDIRNQYNNYQVDLLLVDIAHNNQEQTITGPIARATLNPDGSSLLVQPRHQNSYLYDAQKQQKMADVDAPLVAGPVWTSNTTYIYSKRTAIWQYDTKAAQSTLIGEVPQIVTTMYKADDGSYFVTTYTTKDQAGIYRLGGTSATENTNITTINSLLPYNDSLLSISFTNIGAPTILIETKAPLNNANQMQRFKDDSLQLRQQALKYLTDHGVDLKGITIVYSPADL